MSFTYDNTSISTDLAKLRLAIGDTVLDSGPKPSDGNFTDEELNAIITLTGSWQAAVPFFLRTLANLWSKEATREQIGEYSVTYANRAQVYMGQAQQWEEKNTSGWEGTISWRQYDDSGAEVGHLFGKKQWGADPDDQGS